LKALALGEVWWRASVKENFLFFTFVLIDTVGSRIRPLMGAGGKKKKI
jgi:hypothetical protein